MAIRTKVSKMTALGAFVAASFGVLTPIPAGAASSGHSASSTVLKSDIRKLEHDEGQLRALTNKATATLTQAETLNQDAVTAQGTTDTTIDLATLQAQLKTLMDRLSQYGADSSAILAQIKSLTDQMANTVK